MINRIKFLNRNLEESQVLFLYRFVSLMITSTFYFLNHPGHEVGRKIFIIVCISISAAVVSYLYLKFENSNKNIMTLLCIETVGNSILLIPSGGINSPFIWYSFNTILISATFLKSRYCWINFLMYIFNYYIITYFYTGINLDLLGLIKGESNLLLSFIMIIVAIQAWSVFVKQTKDKSIMLEKANMKLESANKMILESMDHMKSLYQTANILTNQGNKEGLINVLFRHTKSITNTKTVFYYDIYENTNKMILDGEKSLLGPLEEKIGDNLNNILEIKEPKEICVSNSNYILMTVKISHIVYGILGIEINSSKTSLSYKNEIYQLKFLSELIGAAFERLSLGEVNDRLLITEEQNRIANEIHDGVLQRLFSMSCGVYALMKRLDKSSKEDIGRELNLFRKTTDSVMKELRDKIYGLSWNKSGHNSFSMDIKRYIDDIRNMNKVNIPFIISGSEELLSHKQKKALYRIICEGVGNAFRHGKADNIEVSFHIDSHKIILKVIDDGVGFDLTKVNREESKGIGLENLYQLTESLLGEINIQTSLGDGTSIEIIIPNNFKIMEEVKAI